MWSEGKREVGVTPRLLTCRELYRIRGDCGVRGAGLGEDQKLSLGYDRFEMVVRHAGGSVDLEQ